jgi:hypothetical protein
MVNVIDGTTLHEYPDLFRRVKADEDPRYGVFGRQYYPLVFGNSRRDASYTVTIQGRPAALVPCSLGPGLLDWFGMPIRVFLAHDLSTHQQNTALNAALNYLFDIVEREGVLHIILRQSQSSSQTILEQWCLDHGFSRRFRYTAVMDLSLDEAAMRRSLRQSAKPQVNWGKKSLRIDFLNKQNPEPSLFKHYRDFHLAIAGRITRPEASWVAMYDWIIRGRGEIIFGYLGERLVSAAMTVDGDTVAYYASAVYDRSLFDMPLAHWPLWLSILRAKERGMLFYEIGDIPKQGEASPKEVNIGFFKRGFASEIQEWSLWTIDNRGFEDIHDNLDVEWPHDASRLRLL